MDPRERWQALQSHLNAARRSLDEGDRAAALRHADAALSLDPDFLAAHTLRERILSSADVRTTARIPAPIPRPSTGANQTPPPSAMQGRPMISAEGWIRFEQRARQRRVDKRLQAARAAIVRGRLGDARNAIDEVRAIDPDHPDLISVGIELDVAEHDRAARRRSGPWLAAAAVFALFVFGASMLNQPGRLPSHPVFGAAPLVNAAQPEYVVSEVMPDAVALDISDPLPELVEPVSTTGTDDTPAARDAAPMPPAREAAPSRQADVAAPAPASATPPAPQPRPSVVASTFTRPETGDTAPEPAATRALLTPPVSVAAASPPPLAPEPPARAVVPAANTPTSDAPAPAVLEAREEELVRQTLQRYRTAYEELDVNRAQAVWPAVNESALSRAFDGLESQNLVFNECDVRLAGAAASAVCHGSTRYVPKVGSRDARVEPRVWNFTLRKAGEGWQIETARAER